MTNQKNTPKKTLQTAGRPKAWTAFNMAKEVYAEPAKAGSAATMTREAFQQEIMFPIGQPNDAYAKYFTGQRTDELISVSLS